MSRKAYFIFILLVLLAFTACDHDAEPTGYATGQMQSEYLFYQGTRYVNAYENADRLPENMIQIGTVEKYDNSSYPDEEFEGCCMLEIGTKLYAETKDAPSVIYAEKEGYAWVKLIIEKTQSNGGSDDDPVTNLSAEKQPLTFAECMEMFPYVTVVRPAGELISTENGDLSMQFEVIERIRGEFPESEFTLNANDTEIDCTCDKYLMFLERFENVVSGKTSYAAGEIIYLDQKGLYCDSVTDISSTTWDGIIADAKAYAAEHPYKGTALTNGEYIKSTDLKDIYAGSDCVFTAVVKEIENDSVPDRTTVLLNIQKVYKGNASGVDGITVPKSAVSVGETYLFFANRPDDTARFFIVSSQNSIYLPDEAAGFIDTVASFP